jgi:hypothetical protein
MISKESLAHINHLPTVVEGVALAIGIDVLPITRSWDGLRILHVNLGDVDQLSNLLQSIPTTLNCLVLVAPTYYLPLRLNDFSHLINLDRLRIEMSAPPSQLTLLQPSVRLDEWVANLPRSLTTLNLHVSGTWTCFDRNMVRHCIWPPNMQCLRLKFEHTEAPASLCVEDLQQCVRSATCLNYFECAFDKSLYRSCLKSSERGVTVIQKEV